ncbi:MAG TPA: S-methyl-5'-thioadenosine phosphorylase [Candidatus Cybelea sp.]|jgi:5'-methylthioadenosine phosphorylase|nr:S-methyl-5'-thioadenosine phosphorylase [Candidatus Cybelea sp.]
MANELRAEIGVFGGSGFYSLIENAHEAWVETPYGAPSDKVALGEISGRRVAFLPRHGKDHRFPPQSINYLANMYAMKQLGVKWIVGPTACGSLQESVKPGSMVVADQIVDRTTGRKDTFYDGPITTHVSFADPYCPTLRPIAIDALRALAIETHERGTVVVIQGPRFSTRSESKWFQGQGWEVINMTQYPEAYLARELEMCYVNISLITDYDVGLDGMAAVSHHEVIEVFQRNNERVKAAIGRIVENVPRNADCSCRHALEGARF